MTKVFKVDGVVGTRKLVAVSEIKRKAITDISNWVTFGQDVEGHVLEQHGV